MCSLRGPLWKKPKEESSSHVCNSTELLSPSSHLYAMRDNNFMAEGRGRCWRFGESLAKSRVPARTKWLE